MRKILVIILLAVFLFNLGKKSDFVPDDAFFSASNRTVRHRYIPVAVSVQDLRKIAEYRKFEPILRL